MTLNYEEAVALFEPTFGLEVHVELNTKSKMFCSCSTEFGGEPNTQTCPVCLGLPGALPVVNGKAIESTILIGLALNCSIAPFSRFARKNYFYPDMPKNFQTSQYDEPICVNGYLDVEIETDEGTKQFRIEIERVHMKRTPASLYMLGGPPVAFTAQNIRFWITTERVFRSLRLLPRLWEELVSTRLKLPALTLLNFGRSYVHSVYLM